MFYGLRSAPDRERERKGHIAEKKFSKGATQNRAGSYRLEKILSGTVIFLGTEIDKRGCFLATR